jgi:transposase
MKSYSIDLRQKIIDVRIKEKMSIRALAAHFLVAKSFVHKIVQQYQLTGDISPRQRGGNQKPKVSSEDLIILQEIIEQNNDCTLRELCTLLESKTGIIISTSTMDRLCRKLNLTVKKNLIRHRKTQR